MPITSCSSSWISRVSLEVTLCWGKKNSLYAEGCDESWLAYSGQAEPAVDGGLRPTEVVPQKLAEQEAAEERTADPKLAGFLNQLNSSIQGRKVDILPPKVSSKHSSPSSIYGVWLKHLTANLGLVSNPSGSQIFAWVESTQPSVRIPHC